MWVAHEWRSTWGDRPSPRPAAAPGVAHDPPARLPGEPPAARVEEHGIAGGRGAARRRPLELGPARGEVVVERVAGRASDGHDALLAALAEHADQAVVEVEVGAVEADELG